MSATAEHRRIKVYSIPEGRKKDPQWTLKIATSITIAMFRAPNRVKSPKRTKNPPKNSPSPARLAHRRPGVMPKFSTKKPAVALRPCPPNQPNSFCPPWAKKISPKDSLKGSVTHNSSPVLKIFFKIFSSFIRLV